MVKRINISMPYEAYQQMKADLELLEKHGIKVNVSKAATASILEILTVLKEAMLARI